MVWKCAVTWPKRKLPALNKNAICSDKNIVACLLRITHRQSEISENEFWYRPMWHENAFSNGTKWKILLSNFLEKIEDFYFYRFILSPFCYYRFEFKIAIYMNILHNFSAINFEIDIFIFSIYEVKKSWKISHFLFWS